MKMEQGRSHYHGSTAMNLNRPNPKEVEKVSKKTLVNKLNFINFQGSKVTCCFKHKTDNVKIDIEIKPQPCLGNYLVCLWNKNRKTDEVLKAFDLQELIIPDDHNPIVIKPEVRHINKKGMCIRIPDSGLLSNIPTGKRNIWRGVSVRLNQNTVSLEGILADFDTHTVSIILKEEHVQEFRLFAPESKVNIAYIKTNDILFTGEYFVSRQTPYNSSLFVVLEPVTHVIHKRPPKKFRSPRFSLSPAPDIVFRHPFNLRLHSMNVSDLSGSGFAVESDPDNTVLLVGMIIPDIELNFAGAYKIKCTAQVVHRNIKRNHNDDFRVIYGFAILDMPIEDHRKLQGILHQADNRNARLCNEVDTESLWNFFFETGFIYPGKYSHFLENKEDIKQTYERLYMNSPNIARHLTYHEKGRLLGHISMIRFYENAWMIHHHAALKSSMISAGLVVLNQIAQYSYNSFWLESCHMRYLLCYFRPENKFPNFFFKGFEEKISDKKGCSTDTFAYLSFAKQNNQQRHLRTPWELEESSPKDLAELQSRYETDSGGLLIKALDLAPDKFWKSTLEAEFHKSGFTKKRLLFSLKHTDGLHAVIVVNTSDFGLNMSDLTNCIKVFVLKPHALPKDILRSSINQLSIHFNQKKFPVLIYPETYADKHFPAYEKSYVLWILNKEYSDHYFEYLDQVNRLGKNSN